MLSWTQFEHGTNMCLFIKICHQWYKSFCIPPPYQYNMTNNLLQYPVILLICPCVPTSPFIIVCCHTLQHISDQYNTTWVVNRYLRQTLWNTSCSGKCNYSCWVWMICTSTLVFGRSNSSHNATNNLFYWQTIAGSLI